MDKPFKTIAEQENILRSRGMETSSSTQEILMREGYYSVVNGYKDPFIDKQKSRENGHDVFIDGTTFDDLYELFKFDRELRLTLFKYFSMAEETLKTTSSYVFCERHSDEVEPFLDKKNYGTQTCKLDKLIRSFLIALGRDTKRKPKKKLYLEHYLENHDEVPLWVVMKYMMFGEAFQFYCFQTESTRNAIAKVFSELYASDHEIGVKISPRQLEKAYNHIKDFRNICAHDERLYCAKVSPSLDTTFAVMLQDLQLVLPKESYIQATTEIANLLLYAGRTFKRHAFLYVLDAMGAKAVEDFFTISK